LDQLSYPFSPIGEYWLIKHSAFSLQLRMIQAWNANKQPVQGASVIGGVASSVPSFATVCVLMNTDRNGTYILVYFINESGGTK
jgi:hypothetical protein